MIPCVGLRNDAAGWRALGSLAPTLPTSTLGAICRWCDPNGEWWDDDEDIPRADYLSAILSWAEENSAE